VKTKAKGCSTPAPKLLQYRLLKYALEEHSINSDELDPDVDHRNGVINLRGVNIGLKYPLAYLDHIAELDQTQIYDFCFVGHFESFGREESLRPFMDRNSYIQHSEVGRQKKKYDFDTNYYQIMCNSKFGLVPNHVDSKRPKKWQHPNAWSYRFIETIICNTVPVLFKESPLGENWIKGFKYLWNDSNFNISDDEYNSMLEHNKSLSQDRFFLSKEELRQIQNIL
jgi:hypothetical protein